MSYNNYNLSQLLELALRVPEVGAVNFNILYYILKTVIEKEGLEDIRPVFSLEPHSTSESKQTEISRRLVSDESLINDKDYKEKLHGESMKWDKIKVFKRLDTIEEEISSIYIMLSELDGKVSKLDKVSGLQEKRFLKELADLRQSVQSSLKFNEYDVLSEKVENVVSEVTMLKEIKKEIKELREKYERSETEDEFIDEKASRSQFKESDEVEQDTKPHETDMDEEKSAEKIELSDSVTKYQRPKISDLTIELEKPMETTEKEITKPSRHKAKEKEILSKIEELSEEIISIKEFLKSGISIQVPASKDTHEVVKERQVIDDKGTSAKQEKIKEEEAIQEKAKQEKIKEEEAIQEKAKQEKTMKKMDLQLLNVSLELHKLTIECSL